VATFTGCSIAPDADHDGADAPRTEPIARAPRVAWVFSSGGPRGFVHVGVLKALDELQLVPDLIVGASVGALVGCLRASGVPGAEIEALALELQPTNMARLAIWSEQRFSGAPVAELVHRHARRRLLEDMPVPMACVATRLRDQAVLAFTAGDAGVAVQASAAIQGQFTPVRIRGEPHVDADWFAPLPVRLARSLGARCVLAVDASVHVERAPPGAERYRDGDVRKRALVQPDARLADVLLHPDFGYWVSFSRDFRERAIGAGYRATMDQAARLRDLHRVA
jgi:NTE family protein